jgi:hypothetical protein
VLINLVPEFLAVLKAGNRRAAYQRYLDAHRSVLTAYWHNYVLDPDSPQSEEVFQRTIAADRTDLIALLESVDLTALLEDTFARAEDVLGIDRPSDSYLMVGVGAANAGELVVHGRGIAFVAVEHFTGRVNPGTFGMGLDPRLIPLWLAHELAHTVRYTSPDSHSDLKTLIDNSGGHYDVWQAGSRIALEELVLNEGLAVHASQAVAPGFDAAEYFGYARRQYHRLRELEAFLRRSSEPDLERAALGLRLRYLTGGMSPASRLVGGRVIPERAGYYLGYRMAAAMVGERGIAHALRASSKHLRQADDVARGIRMA